ncbi:hypothetical protein RIF29_39123 [Crotalaria pallida]|uniref:RING-type E3 ubiquitin transferase n=1 Tax=Crotalaria pallida TaxID=3830 RepID=A0AAN9E0M8_CROPI
MNDNSSSSPSSFFTKLLSEYITIFILTLIFAVIIVLLFVIALCFLVLFLAIYRVLLYLIRRCITPALNLEPNDQNSSVYSILNEHVTLLKVVLMEMWRRIACDRAGSEQPEHLCVIELLPPPVEYKIHVETSSCSDHECVICLNNFGEDDSCRVLPMCKHIFHSDCIDKWLIIHATCPICRKNVTKCDDDNLQKDLPQRS